MNYKVIYNENYFSGKNSFFYTLGYGRFSGTYFNSLYKSIHKYVKNDFHVLDVGCAYGLMLLRFPDSVQKFGLDVSKYAIDIARSKVPGAVFKLGNAEHRFPFAGIDMILLNDVIEHIEQPESLLKNTYSALKRGGILFITTPNLNIVRKRLFRYADTKEHHISMFTHEDLLDLLERSGFSVLEKWTFIDIISSIRLSSNGLESAFICRKK
ncbi:MAG: class I SAM-dependent methyltransferase [Nanoarchaeota archaeon]|nr:class I SAM-dependent methyltransferase [Nanoarchaeota archaeon]